MLVKFLLCLLFSLNFSSSLWAASEASSLYAGALEKFSQRSEDLTAVDSALADLESALSKIKEDGTLKYKVLILASRASYWRGQHLSDKNEQMAAFEKGMKHAGTAKDVLDTYADAYYYYAVCLAGLMERRGLLESFGQRKQLFQSLDQAIARQGVDGVSGRALDNYGPLRIYGRLYFQLPGFAGGSIEKSVRFLKEAYEKASNNLLNITSYAETIRTALVLKGGVEKACPLLVSAIRRVKADLVGFNPDRVPETRDELVHAELLQQSVCSK